MFTCEREPFRLDAFVLNLYAQRVASLLWLSIFSQRHPVLSCGVTCNVGVRAFNVCYVNTGGLMDLTSSYCHKSGFIRNDVDFLWLGGDCWVLD